MCRPASAFGAVLSMGDRCAFKHRPDVFRGIIAASPALVERRRAGRLNSQLRFGTRPLERSLFFTVGDEPEGMVGPPRRLDSALSAVAADRLRRNFTPLPDEHHRDAPHLTLYNGLKFVFGGCPVAREPLAPPLFSPEALQASSAAESARVIEESSRTIHGFRVATLLTPSRPHSMKSVTGS